MMGKIISLFAAAVVGIGLSLAIVGCGSSTSPKDKMGSEKMKDDKMKDDKMGDKMKDDKMKDDKK